MRSGGGTQNRKRLTGKKFLHVLQVFPRDLQDKPCRALAEKLHQRRQVPAQIRLDPRLHGKCHFRQGDSEAPLRDIMSAEHQTVGDGLVGPAVEHHRRHRITDRHFKILRAFLPGKDTASKICGGRTNQNQHAIVRTQARSGDVGGILHDAHAADEHGDRNADWPVISLEEVIKRIFA